MTIGQVSKAILATWLFWLAISFWNPGLLGALPLLPVLPLTPAALNYYGRFLDFLFLPIGLAAAMAAIFIVRRARGRSTIVTTVLANAIFLATLLLAAEGWRYIAMHRALAAAEPDCWYVRPFITSIAIGGREFNHASHALYRKGDQIFVWSYRDVGFFEVPETTYRNLDNVDDCRPR